MRAWQGSGLVVLLLLFGAPTLQADEPSGEGAARHPVAGVAEKALEALRLRLEARIHEGELLAKAGRLEEALEAYRSIGQLYEQGMEQVRRLIADLAAEVPAPAAASRPDEPATRPDPFPMRRRSGTPRPDPGKAVDAALDWLAAHQGPSGEWGAAEYADWCNGQPVVDEAARPDGLGKAFHDVGVTGLALMAFLGAGYAPRGNHPHTQTLARGLQYLRSVQDAEGCIGPRTHQQYMYDHGIAALAVVEAYGITGSPILKQVAQKALDFIAVARNPYMVWRYGVKPGDNDTSVTAWMVMALKSADLINKDAERRGQEAPLAIDPAAFDGVRAWLDKVTDPDYGRVGYMMRGSGPARPREMVDRFPAAKSEAMTAAGILMRVFLGEDVRKSALVRKGAELCRKLPPVWNTEDGSIDMLYWYHGTLAMFQVGGRHWRDWNQALVPAVLKTQRQDTDACRYKGSWDPVGVWGAEGGRVASTALMTLCLEVYYRYDRVFGSR